MKKFINCVFNNSFGVIFIAIIIFYLFNISNYLFKNPGFLVLIPAIIILMLWYFLYCKLSKIQQKSDKKLSLIIFFGSFIIYLIWGLFAKTQPISDYEVIFNGAKDVINGTFAKQSFDPTNYFYYYNHQIGHTLFVAIEMFFTGGSLAALKILEIIFLSATNLLLYKSVKKIFSDKSALIITIVYSTLIFNVLGSSVINNQHITAFFYMLGLYFFVKNDKILGKILCGMLVSIATIIRPSSIIILLGFVFYLIWLIIKKSSRRQNLIHLTMIILSFFITTEAINTIVVKTHLAPSSITEPKVPYFKYILGFQWHGLHNIPTIDKIKNTTYLGLEKENFNYEEYNEKSKKYIIDSYLHNTASVLRYIRNRLNYFTAEPDCQVDWAKRGYKDTLSGQVLVKYGYAEYLLLIIFSLISVILYLKNKIKNKKDIDIYNLFIIIFIGYFLVHTVIECQTRYRYDQYIMLTIISLPIVKIIFEYLDNKVKKITNKNIEI